MHYFFNLLILTTTLDTAALKPAITKPMEYDPAVLRRKPGRWQPEE